jgi:tetratricopeptide (TPR) repeat protein
MARTLLVLATLLLAVAYIAICATRFAAAYLSGRPELTRLRWAVRLEPDNAEYRYLEGRYYRLVVRDANAALPSYRAAVSLNPHNARYWFDLAAAYQFLDYTDGQRDALEHALRADPTTPEVAWQAANFYVVQGDMDNAMKEIGIVLAYDPQLTSVALPLCWRLKPDIDALLRDVIPPTVGVYASFLDYLVSQKQLAAANKVWVRLTQLHQPVERQSVFSYIRGLLSDGEVEQARTVWQQAASLSDLSAYQPTSENLIINGDFSLDILNGGFDWLYNRSPQVGLTLDPTRPHTGNRSLLISFDASSIRDAGIRQAVPVSPNTTYQFSAYYRAEGLYGAGGVQFSVQDVYDGTTYFVSDDMENVDFWKQVGGDFVTGPQARLLVVHIQRAPPGPIKGKLWIDGVRLMPKAVHPAVPEG